MQSLLDLNAQARQFAGSLLRDLSRTVSIAAETRHQCDNDYWGRDRRYVPGILYLCVHH